MNRAKINGSAVLRAWEASRAAIRAADLGECSSKRASRLWRRFEALEGKWRKSGAANDAG